MQRWMLFANRYRTALLFLLYAGILTAGYAFNTWRAIDQPLFYKQPADSEASVLGRILIARHRGFATDCFFIGTNFDFRQNPKWPGLQYMAYTLDYTNNNYYMPYLSQIGAQGTVYVLIESALGIFGPDLRLAIMHFLTALILACVMAALLLWVHREFGRFAAVTVLVAACFSPWMTRLAKDLYWVLWVYFLPMLCVLWLLAREEKGRRPHPLLLVLAPVPAMIVKCACGYEYIPTVLVSLLVPVVYYAYKNQWPVRQAVLRLGLVGVGGLLGLALTMSLHLVQLTAYFHGQVRPAIVHIERRLMHRTVRDAHVVPPGPFQVRLPVVLRSQREVLGLYFGKSGFGAITPLYTFAVSYGLLCLLFGFSAFALRVVFARYPHDPGERRKFFGLFWAVVLGGLGSLSWFLLFIGHSFEHPHLDSIVWEIPTMPLGFALLGYAFTLYLSARERRAAVEAAGQLEEREPTNL